ncbi:MAG: hypothetical protein JZD41_01745 [Thermoproteus sp.]|nr:hypothetical protein [Thermoproteus sp.]
MVKAVDDAKNKYPPHAEIHMGKKPNPTVQTTKNTQALFEPQTMERGWGEFAVPEEWERGEETGAWFAILNALKISTRLLDTVRSRYDLYIVLNDIDEIIYRFMHLKHRMYYVETKENKDMFRNRRIDEIVNWLKNELKRIEIELMMYEDISIEHITKYAEQRGREQQ